MSKVQIQATKPIIKNKNESTILSGGKSLDGFKSRYSSTLSGVSQICIQQGTKIAKLQERGNFYANRIEQEVKKLQEVELEIEKAQTLLDQKRKDIMNKKREDGNDNNPSAMANRVKSMNHRLDLIQKMQNEQANTNEDLKELINKMRREKNIFDNIYKEMQKELQGKKERLKKILTQSQLAKQEIENGMNKLNQFREDSKVDKDKILEQLENIYQIYDAEGKESTLQRRFNVDIMQVQASSHYNGSTQFITQPENELPPMSREQKIQYTKEKETNFQEKEKQQLLDLKKQVKVYEDIFTKLKEETGKNDMNDIAKTLVAYEEDNFSLFRYINGLREELDQLEQQKINLTSQISKEKVIPLKFRDHKQMKKFLMLKENIKQMEDKKAGHVKVHEELMNQFEELKINFPIIYQKMNCGSSIYAKEFRQGNANEELDESNIYTYLSIIERRMNDFLQIYQENIPKNQIKNKDKDDSLLIKSQLVQKEEDLKSALDLMGEEIEDINSKLQDTQKHHELQIKDKKLMSHNQLAETAKGEIQKLIKDAEKAQKTKIKKRI